MLGSTSFFCLLAGRISSRSTGTPRETRKSRRMRLRIQLGGCSGGGATSWDQRDALRSVRIGSVGIVADGSLGVFSSEYSSGNNSAIYGDIASRMSLEVWRSAKFRLG